MSNNLITGIDIGSSHIKAISVIKTDKSSVFEVMAKTSRPSRGVRKGVIENPEEMSMVIMECIKEIELQTNERVDGVYVNINGTHIKSFLSKGLVSVSRADQRISPEDIERVVEQAKAPPMSRNKEIIDAFPIEYIIDGVGDIKNPLDIYGVRFESKVVIIEGRSQFLKNVSQSVLGAEIEINDIIIGSLASSRAVLTSDEKERGVAVVDIGAQTTSLSVFEEGVLIYTAIFPVGSVNITNDIAIGLKIDIETAERIKLGFGSCSLGGKKIEKINVLGSDEKISFSRNTLKKIINPRILELFDFIREDLKKISKNELLPSGIVITGGGSQFPGISDLAKKELNLPCRIGAPLGFNPPIKEPNFTVCCGLVLLADDHKDDQSCGFFKKITDKIKNFFKPLIP